MSRVALGIITVSVAGLLTATTPAAAGCCGWSQSWTAWSGWGTGCCATTAYVAPVVAVTPAPVVVVQPVVQPAIWVNQGPVFSGPGPNFAPDVYLAPVRAYPYVSGGCGWNPCYGNTYYAQPAAVAYRPYRVNKVRAYRPVYPLRARY